jgi:hypothetical protein
MPLTINKICGFVKPDMLNIFAKNVPDGSVDEERNCFKISALGENVYVSSLLLINRRYN